MKILNKVLIILFCFPILISAQGDGIGIDQPTTPCLMEDDRLAIKQQIQLNKERLNLTNNTGSQTDVVDNLIFPIVLAESIPGYHHFHGVSNYVDHNMLTLGILDYNCMQKSYNGHKGTDFFTFPFSWYLYENDLAQVVSAAAGTIVLKQDGNYDLNCIPNGMWNAVYIQHADGSVMWYGHLKTNSLTSKNVGDTVAKGEYLGVVASSGYSTGPHLHIEYYDEDDNLLDPFQGACNLLNLNSLWEDQPDHLNPRVNAILTHPFAPTIECGLNNESVELKNDFISNEIVYVGVYITDYQMGDIIMTRIYRPDNSLYNSFNSVNTQNSYGWFWNWRPYQLTDNDPAGIWRIESTLNNHTVSHTFTFNDLPTHVNESDLDDFSIYPNPANDEIYLEGIDLNNSKYQLVDCYGKIIRQDILNLNTISLEGLVTGLYYLTVTVNNHPLSSKKVVKY